MNAVNARRARLLLVWVTVFGQVYRPTRSTQPCINPGSLNREPASAGGKGGKVTSVGWQVTLCDTIWHASSHSREAGLTANCYIRILYFTLYLPLFSVECDAVWTRRCGGRGEVRRRHSETVYFIASATYFCNISPISNYPGALFSKLLKKILGK